MGGQVGIFGKTAEYTVGIAHPEKRTSPVLELVMDNGSVATSGFSQRQVSVNGRRYGHIIDPENGLPVADFGSLTVWAADATAADCLSTGLYVMGPDKAMKWAAEAENIEIVVLQTARNSPIRCRTTAGLKGRLRSLGENINIEFQ